MRATRPAYARGLGGRGTYAANLSGSSYTEGRDQRVGTGPAMGSDDALDERPDARAVEDVELRRILLEDLGEGELLNGAAPVVGGVEGDVGRGRVLLGAILDGEEAIVAAPAGRRRPQPQEDLEEMRRGLWRLCRGIHLLGGFLFFFFFFFFWFLVGREQSGVGEVVRLLDGRFVK